MESVVVRKNEILQAIEKNREKHRAIFEEAVEGYKTRAVEMLEDHIERIKNGKLERVYVVLPEPSDHTADYDRAIAMLKMHVPAEIEIDTNSFANYVLDDWHWKREFLTTNAAYSATAASLT